MNHICVECAQEGSLKCSLCGNKFCGRQCWIQSNHINVCSEFIGTKQELIDEYAHRLSVTDGNPIGTFVGPEHMAVAYDDRKGSRAPQVWLIGEKHSPKQGIVPDKLDVTMSDWGSGIEFTGTNSNAISSPRLLYAIAEASKRKNKTVDLYLESMYFNRYFSIPSNDDDDERDLDIIEEMFARMQCFGLAKNKRFCDVYPNFTLYLADYRRYIGSHLNDFHNSVMGMIIYVCMYVIKSSVNESSLLLVHLSEFIASLGKGWAEHEFWITMAPGDHFAMFKAWVEEPLILFTRQLKRYKSLKDVTEGIWQLLRLPKSLGQWDQKEVHIIYKEFSKLKAESESTASKVYLFIQNYFVKDLLILDFLADPKTWFQYNMSSVLTLLVAKQAMYMDIPLICRMLRTYDKPVSHIKIVYAGGLHAYNIQKFFTFYGSEVTTNVPLMELSDFDEHGRISLRTAKDSSATEVFIDVVNEFIK